MGRMPSGSQSEVKRLEPFETPREDTADLCGRDQLTASNPIDVFSLLLLE